MANVTFTQAQLEAMTSKALKRMCIDELNIAGVSKKSKDIVIAAILAQYSGAETASATAEIAPASAAATAAPAATTPVTTPMGGLEFSGESRVQNPTASFGSRAVTTLTVSCGASSGKFPVVGRTVKDVGEFLREVLNVDRLSTGLVNGKEVSADYILQPTDSLEFLKPAGKKG